MQLVVHGGAGRRPAEPDARQTVLDRAADVGSRESTPLDAVETAVRVLESDPQFNAGVGGAVQSDGVVRTDAGLMTHEREVGAVCSMPGVEHAIGVARAVMEETPHVFVSGDHAVELADAVGIETGVDLWTDRTRERWAEATPPEAVERGQRDVDAELAWLRDRFGETDPDGREEPSDDPTTNHESGVTDGTDHDTVGAVASDGSRLAAATSTGGRWYALAGRVGDVPQVGAGYFCTPTAGASATGAGEDIARTTLARRAVGYVDEGHSPAAAADRAIEAFAEQTGSTAGVIVCDADGSVGSAFNSAAMQIATASR